MVACLLGVFLLGCGERPHFSHVEKIDSDGWKFENPVQFEFEIMDTAARYDIVLKITHSKDFGYENIYTRITTTYPDQDSKTQTLPIELANQAGVWFGDCGGSRCEVEVVLQQNAFFDQAGEHSISFEQYTREDPLVGVFSVHLSLRERQRG